MTRAVPRDVYHLLYGLAEGDRVQLADTDLWLTVDRSLITPGEEVLVGAGRNLRDGLAIQSGAAPDSTLDAVVIQAVVVDPLLGVVKADIGIKGDRVVGVGQAGNPDISSGVDLTVGSQTVIIPGWGLLATPGSIDTHVHFLNGALADTFCRNGYTTLIGASPGPSFDVGMGTAEMFEATAAALAAYPVNLAFLGRAVSSPGELAAHLEVGCSGFKIHEDFGAFPAVIDAALRVADEHDVQTIIHTDTINESLTCAETLDAVDGRTIHAYHVEGAGGGHAPDILEICNEPNVLPSSTNPTNPFTRGALGEHLDMIMAVHLNHPQIAEDLAFAQSRVRPSTMAAEDVLHDLGAISMLGSDSNGMGRAGESVRRTWQLADTMKRRFGNQGGSDNGRSDNGRSDNERILRYLEKYTLCPAVAHGIGGHVGSLAPGHLADIVLWQPQFFGVKPTTVIKSGVVSYAAVGTGNGSTLFTEPVVIRPQWGAVGPAAARFGRLFTSRVAHERTGGQAPGGRPPTLPVTGTRRLSKADMSRNGRLPKVRVDPDSFAVTIDGEPVRHEATGRVPLSRRYLLS